jgi:DNA mismatch repair protein PMS2
LALKHYTSKLATYDDLTTLQTFGFRGEALSSLCALSHFSVVTCTKEEAPKAKKLEFETSGKLKSTSIVSGQKGTTVVVEDLFYNLPVRRRELERNIKREWGKVINLLNQYACVQTGVKFSVSQQPTKGKRMLLFSTKGNRTTRENIINVFGVKTLSALIPLDLKLELVPTQNPLHKRKASDDGGIREILVKGHVSRPAHGEGRQTPDRQMFYVNGRPCGLPQFAKVFNEVYRSYNSSQSPFIFADIQLDTHLYDVNVSPDKRTILLHDQGQMLDNLRESLVELFEQQDVTVPVSQLANSKQTPFKRPSLPRQDTAATDGESSARSSPFRTPSAGNKDDIRESEEDDESDKDDENSDNEVTVIKIGSNQKKSNSTRRLASRSPADVGAMNLMSRWVERKAGDKESLQPAKPTGEANEADPHATIISARQKLVGDLSKAKELAETGRKMSRAEEPNPTTVEHEAQDQASADHEDKEGGRKESPIPSLPPPSQVPRPTLPPTTRSPRRTGQQVAIRIDDETITGVIGSQPQAKRHRTDAGGGKTVPKPRVPLPSFGGRLSQMFAAAGASQPASVQDEDNVNDDDDEEPVVQEEADHELNGSQDADEELFVAQDDEDARTNETQDQESILGELNAEEQPKSGPSEERDQEMVDQTGQDDGDISQPGSDQADQEEDSDYVNDIDKAAEGDPGTSEEVVNVIQIGVEPSEDTLKRQQLFLKGTAKRKDATVQLLQRLKTDETSLHQQMQIWRDTMSSFSHPCTRDPSSTDMPPGLLDTSDAAEEKLSLKISKSDFARMKIIGQFNLGFIIAVREASLPSDDDELFIIDQHASDEKFNFERLQATTTLQSQRLVTPKTLDLTAMEEEIILNNIPALETNGFKVSVSDTAPVGSRIQLLSLPLSRETTFSVADLEELIFLLGDNPTGSATTVPRPGKVRRMFAMRACRSSIMIGKALNEGKMREVVRHMGEMEKPWNCPHGRPTMRHLTGLGAWDAMGWDEDCVGEEGEKKRVGWGAWLRERKRK